MGHHTRKLVFQPSIFRCYVRFGGCMYVHHKKCPLCLKHLVIIITPPLPAGDRQNLAPPKICKDTSQHFKKSEQKHGDISSILNCNITRCFSSASQARAENLEKILLKERKEHQDTRVSLCEIGSHESETTTTTASLVFFGGLFCLGMFSLIPLQGVYRC